MKYGCKPSVVHEDVFRHRCYAISVCPTDRYIDRRSNDLVVSGTQPVRSPQLVPLFASEPSVAPLSTPPPVFSTVCLPPRQPTTLRGPTLTCECSVISSVTTRVPKKITKITHLYVGWYRICDHTWVGIRIYHTDRGHISIGTLSHSMRTISRMQEDNKIWQIRSILHCR